ncbi:MAG: response regulator transcription factor [Deltaproteobacteria bacterium]|nr:response regulator transcription factor [Deltaproteobacteria bacterium]
MGKRRILVVEDHPIFRLGLRELIDQEDDLEVCAESDDIAGALAEIPRSRPDLVIVDLALKGRSGIDLIREIRDRHGKLPVLVVSMYEEALYAERALAAGARGYVMKQEASDSIVQALRCVLEGRFHLSDKMTTSLLGRLAGAPGTVVSDPIDRLTDRELEVFRMIGQGLTTGEIAARLHLSAKTIGTYRERIKEKLNLKTAGELTVQALRRSGGD